MIIRTPNDDCLLCQKNKATKKNSHIASKFLGKSILGKTGPRKGYILDSSKPHVKPRVFQDSPKESYILCPDCEKYLECLETYVAENFTKRLLNERFNKNFEYKMNEGGVEYAICKNLNNKLFRLFIISLFWRGSISNEEPFTSFNISEQDKLRVVLQESNSTDIQAIKLKKPHANLHEFQIVVMRSKNSHDPTGNFFYANGENDNLYQLILNEYKFFISLESNSALQKFQFLNNVGNTNFIIGLLPDQTWRKLRKGLIDLATKKSLDNAKKMGVKPWNL
ncbi:hypothetical protein PZB74_20580 [Porifericola rhodea]|uniref:hypothetical protein n=1 Tax=Porifericola rhodea TaxID=930972 RepID=UPI002665D658|nr:hypothetical protein [Porifericola rhodea]WKN31349.1 hypothetical protein PZB74_20580 [Porifericola rhodea]